MKPRQILGKYFEVYGQGNPITPEAGKKGSFLFLALGPLKLNFLPRSGFKNEKLCYLNRTFATKHLKITT